MAYDEARLIEALKNADAAGDMEAATKIAQIIQSNRAQPDQDPRKALAEAAMAQYPVASPEQIASDAAAAQLASEQGPLQSLAIGMGKGFYNIGRGLGIAEPADEVENKYYAALSNESPISTTAGEIIGESAPFVIPGAGAGKIASVVPRAAAMAGLGAAQGAVSARGRGEDLTGQMVSGTVGGAVAGGIELALPYIGRAAGAVVRRVTGADPRGALIDAAGRPTAELQDALAKSGLSYDDLAQKAMQELTAATPGTNPQQAARAALFQTEGIPATKGAITKEFGQQAQEARLAESVNDAASDPFRAELLKQSEAVRGNLDDLITRLGVPERTGEAIKDALSGQKSLLKSEKSALYKKAAKQAEDLGIMPIIPDNIAAAVPEENVARRISRLVPGQVGAIDDLLIEFGIKGAPEGFAGKVTPLSLNNLEDFRSAINTIERSDNTGAIKVLSGPIKSALDEEAELMAEAVENSGVQGASELIGTLKQARSKVRELKTEFSPQAVSGKLIEVKRDGVTPIVEASKVTQALFSKAMPVEQLKKTLSNLAKQGDKGKQAIGDLQATAAMQLMDEAFGASSRTINGVKTFGPGAFQAAIKRIGDDKLNLIFSNNKEALAKIKNLEKISTLMQPPSGAVPKGSASVNLDLAKRLFASKIPGAGQVLDLLDTVKASGATRREVEAALDARPDIAKLAMAINRDYPSLATAIGIAGYGQSKEPEPLVINRGR